MAKTPFEINCRRNASPLERSNDASDDGVAYLGGPYAAIEGKVPLTL
jgi:hypothetical protein